MQLKRTLEEGQFKCPNCSTLEPFRRRASRPFLTIYFIPTVPVGKVTEFIQCMSCKKTYQTDILNPSGGTEFDESRFSQDDHVLLTFIAAIMCDDGHVTESEIAAAKSVFEVLRGKVADREDLGAYCAEVQTMELTSLAYVQQVHSKLNEQQKRQFVQSAFVISSCSGEFTDNRHATLLASRELFDMPESEYRRAIEETLSWP
jgi:hypothetical protein